MICPPSSSTVVDVFLSLWELSREEGESGRKMASLKRGGVIKSACAND